MLTAASSACMVSEYPPMACHGLRGYEGNFVASCTFQRRTFMTRIIVYIDGFNLYYRALKGTMHKWLDVEALCRATLPAGVQIVSINYYTARVSGLIDPAAPARQNAYLSALGTLPLVGLHYGRFMVTSTWMGLVQPPEFRPPCSMPTGAVPQVVRVRKLEEKGSDVNLGVHLVRDALTGAFDAAAVLTNDTDLVEPLRIVTEERNLPLTLLSPVANPARSLMKVATHVRHVAPYIGPCQFPQTVTSRNGKIIVKPASW